MRRQTAPLAAGLDARSSERKREEARWGRSRRALAGQDGARTGRRLPLPPPPVSAARSPAGRGTPPRRAPEAATTCRRPPRRTSRSGWISWADPPPPPTSPTRCRARRRGAQPSPGTRKGEQDQALERFGRCDLPASAPVPASPRRRETCAHASRKGPCFRAPCRF